MSATSCSSSAAISGDRASSRALVGSKLLQLVELVLSRPLVSSAMIEKELKVTTRGALDLVAELSLREITGRGRDRAWGIV